jgi:NADPH2:quinone reductase
MAPYRLPCDTRGVKAIQLREFGGADSFELVELDDPTPGDGEVLVEVSRSGVNFADTHATKNDYLAEQELPLVPGAEVAGRTADGRRVVALVGTGGYAERVVVPESNLIPIPDQVDDEQAAGALLQGLTAMALVNRMARIEAGETIVIEAAAGGTGTLAVQIAKGAGARVIGLASSAEKRELVESLGADATVDSRSDDLRGALLDANDGKKVDAVLHMSGGDAFDAELSALAPLGRIVVFGNASRDERSVPTGKLLQGSKAVIGFWLVHILLRQDLAVPMIGELLGALATGALRVTIGGVYPLSEAARAHEALESRASTGKLLLDPSS